MLIVEEVVHRLETEMEQVMKNQKSMNNELEEENKHLAAIEEENKALKDISQQHAHTHIIHTGVYLRPPCCIVAVVTTPQGTLFV